MTPSFKLLDADSIESASKINTPKLLKRNFTDTMTQIFKKTLLTSLVLFLMTACSDDKKELKIIVEPTSFHFEQTGGSKKFGITPNEPATFQVRKHGAK